MDKMFVLPLVLGAGNGFLWLPEEGFGVSDAAGLGAHGEGDGVGGADPAGAKSIHKQALD